MDGLDPVMRRQVWNLLLSDVKQENATVLVSSHNLKELEDVCDHVLPLCRRILVDPLPVQQDDPAVLKIDSRNMTQNRGLSRRFDEKRYEALREVFRTVDERQPIRRLSKGMQKQSAFAAASPGPGRPPAHPAPAPPAGSSWPARTPTASACPYSAAG